MASSPSAWSFTPYPSLPTAILPNVLFYNATNPSFNQTYQISISYPFEWGSSPNVTNKTALTMYVLDGNALGLTAAEGFKRRKPVDSKQPDSIVVNVGYALTDSVYALIQRRIDYTPRIPLREPMPYGADDFMSFVNRSLRPWVHRTVFPGVKLTRDALYGHSGGGLFAIYSLITDPDMFDTYIIASPALSLNNGSYLNDITRRIGNGIDLPGELGVSNGTNMTGPAVFIGYGGAEQFPSRRRTETEADFQTRKNFWQPQKMGEYSHELYDRIKASGRVRDVVLKEYPGQGHSGAGGSALLDGIDYFVDW